MLDVGGERGVGVVDEIVLERRRGSGEGDDFVDGAVFELRGAAAEEAEFGVGVEAAALDPAAKKEVAAAEVESVRGGV